MLAVTASKTYSQWLIDNPNFFDDFIEAGDIDEATVLSINKWYKYRVVCDDYKFTDFFERQLEIMLPRYNKLVRLENTEFDAMVNAYRERQVVGTGSEIGSEDIDKVRTTDESSTDSGSSVRTPDLVVTDDGTNNGNVVTDSTNTNTRTPNLTTTDTGTMSNTSTTENDNENHTTTDSGSTAMDASVAKQNPQSISYSSGFDSDGMPSLDWQYPSSQQQSKSRSDADSSVDTTGSSDTTTTQSGTNGNTNVMTGTDSNSGTANTETDESRSLHNVNTTEGTDTTTTSETGRKEGTYTDSGSVDTTKTSSNTTREQWTGRDGLTPQAALRDAMSYVKGSSAFEWLRNGLEVCFLSVYDI